MTMESFFPKGNGGNFDQVGSGKGLGYNINIPLPHGGFGDADFLAFLEHIVMPVACVFNPGMIFICAGFDSGESQIPRPLHLRIMDVS